MSLSTLTSKGQITIPKDLRKSMSIDAGDKIEFIINEQNEVVIKPKNLQKFRVSRKFRVIENLGKFRVRKI